MMPLITATQPLPFFVYGTLRPGASLYDGVAEFVVHHEPAVLPGFDLFLTGYPAIRVSDRRGAIVHGDLLWTNDHDAALMRCDNIENYYPGVDVMYIRAAVPVYSRSGRAAAWVYLGGPRTGFPSNYLESGDFKLARPELWHEEVPV